jgi:transposase
MRTGRPKAELVVSAEERTTLEGWMRRRTSAQVLALRAGIVLDCAGGLNSTAVARRRRVSKQIVGKWRERFVRHRVAGLLDEPRCGTPRKIEDGQVESVIVRTLESKPRDATHWSTRSMAETSGLSHMTIQRIWRAFGPEPTAPRPSSCRPIPSLWRKCETLWVCTWTRRSERWCFNQMRSLRGAERTRRPHLRTGILPTLIDWNGNVEDRYSRPSDR